MNVITGKLKATPEKARQILDRILNPLWWVNPTRTLYHRGLDLQARYRLSFHDSLIVAAALGAAVKPSTAKTSSVHREFNRGRC